jgi:hypothetical protein
MIAIFAQQQHPQFVYHCASEEGFTPDRLSGKMRIFHHHWQTVAVLGARGEKKADLNSEPEGVLQYRKPKKNSRPRISEYKE